jgi:uncharacterized ParB-like nuclease family protein
MTFIVGCSAAIIFNSEEERLYYEKCGGCHRVYSRSEFSREHWLKEFDEMSGKAKLNENDKAMIRKYLLDDSAKK